MTDKSTAHQKQCFTSIQSKKLSAPLQTFELCPSMDLVVFGTSAHQTLFRTVSWQKVANIQPLEENSQKTSCCWSPNGRWITVAHDDVVSLYGVEPLANPPDGGFSSSTGPTEAQHTFKTSHPVIDLSWMHVGRPHPNVWNISEKESEDENSWRYQSYYVDRAYDFLPPSAYLEETGLDSQYDQNETATATALPGCKTPLSVLCVYTTHHVELYLHGRYLLLKLPHPPSLSPPQLAASTDLTYLMVNSQSRISLYYLPFMKRDRYPLQIIASLHSSIMSHLSRIQASIPEVLNSWKSSLKPLDTKLQPLLALLKNYGVDDRPLGFILKQYILVGHTSDSTSLANAMDQFFTSVQMNDQLLTRMERSLHGSLANVESSARKGLLSPAQALCLQIQELSGLVQYHATGRDPSVLSDFVRASKQLYLSVESLLTAIISGRFQVRDFCAWLRSAGSQIKAQGTAHQSVQRENAKKRRVPQAVLERLLGSLNTRTQVDKQANLTEQLLNIEVSDMLKANHVGKTKAERPRSPTSVALGLKDEQSVADAATEMGTAASNFFKNPLSNVPDHIIPKELVLPQIDGTVPTVVSIHTRVGRDAYIDWSLHDDLETDDPGCFLPKVVCFSSPQLPENFDCRQWSIIAQANRNTIQLFGIPLGWREPDDFDDYDEADDDDVEGIIPFYLTTKLTLPPEGVIRQIGFYSDDGKSSLSSGNDSGNGKEGRQKLCIAFQREFLELWLITYDSLQWQAAPYESKLMHHSNISSQCSQAVSPMPPTSSQDEEEEMVLDGDPCVFAQVRTLTGLDYDATMHLNLYMCGSRGVGGVCIINDGTTTLELLDLEEDEESDEEEDGEEYDE